MTFILENIDFLTKNIIEWNLTYKLIKALCILNLSCNQSDSFLATDYGRQMKKKSSKSQNLGRSILGHWDIFSQFISTHFSTVDYLSMLSIIQPLFHKKTLYPIPKRFEFGRQRIRDLATVCP